MVLNPVVQEGTKDVFSKNLEQGVIHLVGEITDEMAASVVAQLLDLEYRRQKIAIYINSPGGSVSAGLAIYDTMKAIEKAGQPVKTVCLGRAASMGAIILSGGSEREIMPHAEVMIHQPSGGMEGKASDLLVAAEHIKETKNVLNQILSENCGKPVEQVAADTEADHWMNAEEAKAYGIVDRICRE